MVEQPGRAAPPYPLLGEVIAWTPGEELVARRTFDPFEDRYLEDHTLGRDLSVSDPDLRALAIMPLTMSLEILAEAAAALMPGRTVVGMLDVRAYRWIAFEDRPQTLEVTARLRPGAGDKVIVRLRNLTEDEHAGDPPKNPVIEATVAFADAYPPAAAAAPRHLADGTPSRLRPEDLYREHMFHGPSWQGVAAIEQTGARGTIATLRVLPFRGYLRSDGAPRFVLDPAVLDAAGQVIGFWTIEHLDRGRVIFPYRMERLEIYGPGRPAGESLTCVASIELVGGQQVRSDIDVIAGDGRLWMRLVAWEDKRFDLPDRLLPLMHPSDREDVSESWPEPIANLARPELFQCRLLRTDFPSDRGFWTRVWAHRILGRAEREQFRRLGTSEARQLEWLGGRAAAKEAVRALLGSHYGLDVPPADIEIQPDAQGRPLADGAWRDSVPCLPVVSIAHTAGTAVAVAGLVPAAEAGDLLLGVDAADLRARPPGFAEAAFDGEEIRAIRSLPPELQEEWMHRAWCAKEAAAKAPGYGVIERPRPVRIAALDLTTETVSVWLDGRPARIDPGLAVTPLVVSTGRHGDLVVALMLCELAGAELVGEAVLDVS
jgi:phosphopantetheinyl transferase (holo-ACP synthase)